VSARVLAMPRGVVAEPRPVAVRPELATPLTTAVLRALARLGLSDKEIADVVRMSAKGYSKAKHGREGHGLRTQALDGMDAAYRDVFLDALIEELARLRGRTVMRPGGQLARLAQTMRALGDSLDAMSIQAMGQPGLPFASGE
jgi:hypothetical protein